MKGIPTTAGSAFRRENEFQAGAGHAKTSGEASSSLFALIAALGGFSFHSREGSREDAKTRRRPGPWAWLSAKTLPVRQDRTDLKPVEGAGFRNADHGYLGGFEALRLIRFVFRGLVELWRSDRMLVVAREGGFCRPAGAGFPWEDGTQRSRAGLSSGGPPGLGPRLGKARSCQGVSGSNPVLVPEFSIPMPIPIPTRAAGGCRAGSSSAGGVSVRRLRRVGTASFCDGL
jgi:hypothetical protein